MNNPYVFSILILLVIKQIFEKNKSLRAVSESWWQFWPSITPSKRSIRSIKKKYMLWLRTKVPKLQSNRQSAFYAKWTWQKLSFHLRNYMKSSRTWQVLQQLMKFSLIFYWLNWSRKKTLNIIIFTQQTMAPICLHEHRTNRKI